MLNKIERNVMKVIYEKAISKNKTCLISEQEILDDLPQKVKVTFSQLHVVLRQLELDNYFELVHTEKKGEKIMLITLKKNGEAFQRELIQYQRDFRQRIIMSIVCAALAALVGIILRGIL